ncbi:MAG: 50S ribosomal protein L23 [candidate division KSB1 bacterium]|nr:50S ribosomal protein L23 [candidate division KSB1 bacterium]MDZ7301375.1 50S ribosomal protein L23 [candidate division KSB1 bacterium]MDZ7310740.1 50S ribosomal protein L23 [candidate division KSB1 bacterium]
MRTTEEVLIKPVLTEKMLNLSEKLNKYGFIVHREANKAEIKHAVEKKFNVTVDEVHIINSKGKTKRMSTRRGMTYGRRSDRKKAVVTLQKGQKIDFFAG